jgi:hypothetical protein
MSEHDPIAGGRDWYAETDLSEYIASGKVARAPRPRDGEPMSTFALRISDGVLDVSHGHSGPPSALGKSGVQLVK